MDPEKLESGRSRWRFHLVAAVDRLRKIGVDADAVLAKIGLSEAMIRDPHVWLDVSVHNQLWECAVEASGDPDFGLHMAEAIGPDFFDVVGYLARSCSTLGEALERSFGYARLLNATVTLSLDIRDQVAWVHYRFPPDVPIANGAGEAMLACLLVTARQMTGVDLCPIEVHAVSSRPADTREWTRIFGAPIVFGTEHYALVFPVSTLALPVLSADPGLKAVLDRYASSLLSRLPASATFVDRVRDVIARELRRGDPGLDNVARRLFVSPRTLRRRLLEAGTSHQKLLDEFRCELAMHCLRDGKFGVEEVAFELGFSEPSSLRRLVKRSGLRLPGALASARTARATPEVMND